MNESLLQKVRAKFFLECGLAYGINDFTVCKNRFLFINSLKVSRYQTSHPATAVNDIGWPAKFFDRFQSAFTEKNRTQPIVFKPFLVVVGKDVFSFEQVFVIQEIYLQAGIRQRSYLDLQGEILIVDRNIDAREPNHLMQPVTALINRTKTGHDTTNFVAVVIRFNCQLIYNF